MQESKRINIDSLSHFQEAQDLVYEQVLNELKNGKKESHWMWFIFPQLAGLGISEMSKKYAIQDEAHALEYWNHPILGSRLRECFSIVETSHKTPLEIFDKVDEMKYKSSKTIFITFQNSMPYRNKFIQI